MVANDPTTHYDNSGDRMQACVINFARLYGVSCYVAKERLRQLGYDNAVAEAFFKFLKLEETYRRSYHSIEDMELSIFDYIHLYNFKRPHSANNLLSSVQFEKIH